MIEKLRQQDLEILTFLSGLVTSIASATGYFYGEYAAELGPFATLIIVIVWLYLLYLTLQRNLSETKEGSGDKASSRNTTAFLDRFFWGWFFTISIWSVGILYNWFIPQRIFVEGYVLYDSNIHLENAVVEIYYGNEKVIDLYTDGYGYFNVKLQREVDQNHINMYVKAQSFNPFSQQIQLNDFQNIYSGDIISPEQTILLTPKQLIP